MPEIFHTLRIRGGTKAIYRALTQQAGIAGWWTIDCEAPRAAEGAMIAVSFNDGKFTLKLRIEELVENKLVRWRCAEGHPEWFDTEIDFLLEHHPEEGTMLHFTHAGWEHANGILPNCSFDWARYLLSLKRYVEKGVGNPHPDEIR